MPSGAQYGVAQPLLTNYSMAKIPNELFIAEQILPWAMVPDESFEWVDFDDAAFVPSGAAAGTEKGMRQLNGTYDQVEFGFTTAAGRVKEYGFEARIDKREPRQARSVGIDLMRAKALQVRNEFMTAKEIRAATLLFNGTTFAGYTEALTGTNRWDDPLSDPVNQAIKARRLTRRAASARQAGAKWCVAVGSEVDDALQTNAAIASRIVYTKAMSKGNVTREDIAAYLGVDEYHVGAAVYNTVGDDGAGSLTGGDCWGKGALFYWKNANPAPMIPSLGYTFGTESFMTEQYASNERRGDVLRGRGVEVIKVTNAAAARYYSTVIS